MFIFECYKFELTNRRALFCRIFKHLSKTVK